MDDQEESELEGDVESFEKCVVRHEADILQFHQFTFKKESGFVISMLFNSFLFISTLVGCLPPWETENYYSMK